LVAKRAKREVWHAKKGEKKEERLRYDISKKKDRV